MVAQVKVIGVEAVTVKTLVQVTGAEQSLVTVQVTVFAPPQADGAEPPLLEISASQPPVKVALANQAAYAASMAA